MAVRLALAETDIINETKQYLEDEGIDLDSFSKRKVRSNTIILVKNIPVTTTIEDISDLFGKYGSLGRVVVPPTATIAVVEFLEQNEAKAAFRHLAYTKFKDGMPLYLEYAPVNSFKSQFDPAQAETRRKEREAKLEAQKEKEEQERLARIAKEGEDGDNRKGGDDGDEKDVDSRVAAAVAAGSKKALLEKELQPNNEDMDDPDAMPVATLFVKNLSFSTTEAGLRKVFEPLGGVRAVRIATKPDTKNAKKVAPGTPPPVLSMGFGFIEFESKESAIKAMKTLQGFKLDGHELALKFSNAAAKSSGASSNTSASAKRKGPDEVKAIGTKLIIRNIPFEATRKEVLQLFATFGQVKSVRLPKKFDGGHRGFGFVDFLTKQEAKAAYESLSATHLYGRHLVMEWAEDETSVEAMRSKTAKGYFKDGEALPPQKRRKVQLGNEGGGVDLDGGEMSD
jgi:multiple RNA-binding domain-containing protein 1